MNCHFPKIYPHSNIHPFFKNLVPKITQPKHPSSKHPSLLMSHNFPKNYPTQTSILFGKSVFKKLPTHYNIHPFLRDLFPKNYPTLTFILKHPSILMNHFPKIRFPFKHPSILAFSKKLTSLKHPSTLMNHFQKLGTPFKHPSILAVSKKLASLKHPSNFAKLYPKIRVTTQTSIHLFLQIISHNNLLKHPFTLVNGWKFPPLHFSFHLTSFYHN